MGAKYQSGGSNAIVCSRKSIPYGGRYTMTIAPECHIYLRQV